MGQVKANSRRARNLRTGASAALLGWLLTAAPGFAQPANAPAAETAPIDDIYAAEVEELVITAAARGQPGAVVGDIPPEIQLSPREIRAYGASSVADLLDALAPLTGSARGRGGGRPIMLVNGARISSFSEIRDLPPEAILRVDILPEEVALRYGYRADQRVVNFVLRPRFRAVTSEAEATAPTAGGRQSYEADLDILRIDGPSRLQIDLEVTRSTPLLESERDVIREAGGPLLTGGIGDIGRYRTLEPASEGLSVNTVLTRPLSEGVSATLNGTFEVSETESRLGVAGVELLVPAENPFSIWDEDLEVLAPPDGPRALLRTSDVLNGHLGLAVNGALSGWRWSFTANADRTDTQTLTETGYDAAALQAAVTAGDPDVDPLRPPRELFFARAPDQARSTVTSGDAELTANGALVALPAGDLTATFTGGLERLRFDSWSLRAGIRRSADLSRDLGRLRANFDVPIASRREDVLAGLGDLSANLNLGAEELSDFGRLTTVDAGVNWSPVESLRLSASITEEDGAPTVQQLGEPETATPGVRVFDFLRGETVEVTRISGGNPALAADSRRVVKLGLNWKPFDETEFTLRADYVQSRIRDVIASFPTATAEIEAAFPERFVRDAEGRLVLIDSRPVNFARQDREEVRWGFHYSRRLGPERRPDRGQRADGPPVERFRRGGRGGGGNLQLALFHTIRLEEEILIREGVPVLDLLEGSAVGATGGQPRHEVFLRGAVSRNGLGARLGATWRSDTEVLGGPFGGEDLEFSDLAIFDLRLFADLGARPIARRHPWLRGARISLEVDNIFDARQRVRNAAGETPVRYQPDLLNPLGRTIEVSFRKIFF